MQIIRTKTPIGKALEVNLRHLKGKIGKVGWFEKSKYDNGVSVAYIATIQEYGYPQGNIPPRPFFRPTIAKQQNEWRIIAQRGSKAVIEGKMQIGDVMEQIGLKATGDVKETISLILTPPLSPRTIQARLARRANKKTMGLLTKPLIDTGLMLNTLTNTVESE